MKLNHVALSVNDSEEIENFHEDILVFSLQRKFLMAAGIANNFFGVNKEIDVYFMKKTDVWLEIFLYPEKKNKIFNHLCLEYFGSEVIYTKSQKSGYKSQIKINPGRNNSYFIWDRCGNMFELKEAKNG